MPRIRLAMRSGWNGSKSSSFSPVPTNRIGLPTTFLTDSAAPPRASPSILVRITPSRPTASSNAVATFTASWPVIASTTSSVSVGLDRVAHVPELVHQLGVDLQTDRRCRRSRGSCRAAPLRRSDVRATSTGSFGPSSGADHTGRSSWRPSTRSCSTAAGRCRSAATSSTLVALALEHARELAGGGRLAGALQSGEHHDGRRLRAHLELAGTPPSVVTSSSCTILMTCWPGSGSSARPRRSPAP